MKTDPGRNCNTSICDAECGEVRGRPKHCMSLSFKVENLIDIMYQDKKVINKELNFIILKQVGKGIVSKNVNIDIVKKILNSSLNFPK